MSDIKKGDQVQLKSGGPIMTVQEIGDYSMSDGIENGAKCVWFDGNKPLNISIGEYIDFETMYQKEIKNGPKKKKI